MKRSSKTYQLRISKPMMDSIRQAINDRIMSGKINSRSARDAARVWKALNEAGRNKKPQPQPSDGTKTAPESVWAAEFCSCQYESGFAIINLFTTRKQAREAVRKHKKEHLSMRSSPEKMPWEHWRVKKRWVCDA